MQVDLSVEISGIRMKNPSMLASGILGVSASTLVRVAEAGAGGVVTKSIGVEPKEGYSGPTLVEVGKGVGFLNAMGLSNPGFEAFKEDLILYKKRCGVPLIVSIFGSDAEEFQKVASGISEAKPDGYELNVSCPHGGRYGAVIGSDPSILTKVVKAVKDAVDRPVFVKLTPNVTDISNIAMAAEKAEADAITAINTLKAMVIDIHAKKPILGNKFGGLSGPAIRPIAVRCIYEIFEKVEIPIIGVGGITRWEDALEFILAGAKAFQIGSALSMNNFKIFDEITKGLANYMEQMGIKTIDEMVGIAHE